jgi:hypothetical protein
MPHIYTTLVHTYHLNATASAASWNLGVKWKIKRVGKIMFKKSKKINEMKWWWNKLDLQCSLYTYQTEVASIEHSCCKTYKICARKYKRHKHTHKHTSILVWEIIFREMCGRRKKVRGDSREVWDMA